MAWLFKWANPKYIKRLKLAFLSDILLIFIFVNQKVELDAPSKFPI